MAHPHCMLDNYGYKHTLWMCNTHSFSTATVVPLTRLIVTLYIVVEIGVRLVVSEWDTIYLYIKWVVYCTLGSISHNTSLCESVRSLCAFILVRTWSYFCPFFSCPDWNELLWHVRKVAFRMSFTRNGCEEFQGFYTEWRYEVCCLQRNNNEGESNVKNTDKKYDRICAFYYVCVI